MKQITKLIAAFSAAIVIFTGCGQTDEQRAVFPETMTEIDCTVTEEITETDVQNTSEENIFNLKIPELSRSYNNTYNWRIIGSLEAIDELSYEICASLDELYEWCFDVDFSQNYVFVDFSFSNAKAVDAYTENGMTFFETEINPDEYEDDTLSLFATVVPKEEPEVLMFKIYCYEKYDAAYIFGSSETLEACSEILDLQSYAVIGDNIYEWGKNIDFTKYSVALKMDYSPNTSSCKEILRDGVYVENDNIIFDYEVICPTGIACGYQTFFIAGIVPKDELDFLEMDDPSGFCRLLPTQYE